MSKALKNYNTHVTAQTAQADPAQVVNNAGGYSFEVTPKSRLERFLILGTDGGTYYVSESKLTEQNASFLKELIAKDEKLVRDIMVDIAVNNRAHKVSPTIFTAAMLHTYGVDKAALKAELPKILRTSTHLFEYAQYVKNIGGWGRSKRGAIKDWYENKSDDSLGLQVVKYRQRNGWTHRDLLRISHAQPSAALAQFVLGKDVADVAALPDVVQGYLKMSKATSVKEVLSILSDYPSLPWETIPTEFHKDANVWKTLFRNGSLRGTALLRNVVRLARLDAFTDLDFAADYAEAIRNPENVKASRLHPINYLNAAVVYSDGQINRDGGYGYAFTPSRNKNWTTESVIHSAIEDAFMESFKTITPANKRTLVALDVSGSMGQAAAGLDLSCAQVAGAMAMTIVRTEPKALVRGFSGNFVDLGVSAKDSLNTVMRKISNKNFGGTDCSLPMVWAEKEGVAIDTFAVFTDNETYAGRIHPHQALVSYRKATGIAARQAVFGVSATNFTIADPKDTGTMDFVGFDASAPAVFADFSAGRL